MRRSTLRGAQRLGILLDALAVRDLDLPAMSSLLGCSPSAVRNYVFELLGAGVIVGPPTARPGAAGARTYRLSAAARVVENPHGALDASLAHARRDPLVAALFGAASPRA